MKIFLATFLAASLALAQSQIPNNTVKLGQKNSNNKDIIFDVDNGATNPRLRANGTTKKLQFTNDGTVFKDIGSGSGGGGSGINLLSNGGFETGIADGWTSSGGTFAEVSSGSNLLYQEKSATFTASATAQYFETALVTTPEILGGQDCMAKIDYKGASSNLFLTVLNSSNVNITNGITTVLSSVALKRDAKLYFTCPSAGTQMKLRVQSTAASAIGAFDEISLGGTDFNSVSGIVSETNYTPTFTGLGTPTNVDIKFSRVGKTIRIIGRFASGTSTAVGASFSLPNGYTVSNKNTAGKIFGRAIRIVAGASVVRNLTLHAGANGNALAFGLNEYAAANNPASVLLGTDFVSAGQEIVLEANVEVNELPESETVASAKCPTDIACENTFSAKVSNAGIVSDENLDWINGNCSGAAPYICGFNASIFTVAPNCSITLGSTGGTETRINALSASSITVAAFNSAGGTSNTDFHLVCRKTGGDFKAKQNIQGFLSSTITSSANNERLERVSVGTVCTSSPCTIARQSGAISSVSRTATGEYAINFTAGTFSQPPTCTCSNTNASGNGFYCPVRNSINTTTQVFLVSINTAAAAADSQFDVLCMGPR